jgi:hypothetical protein
MASMTSVDPIPTNESSLPAEFSALCQEGRAKILVVRARPGPERFALTTAVLATLSGPGVVVATSAEADGYREFFARRSTGPGSRWVVLKGGNSEGGIRAVARALARARELVVETDREDALAALWLPGHILEAFGLLPADGSGLVVVDSWDGLISEYLPGAPPGIGAWPSPEELETILVRTLRRYAQSLVVVIVDSASRSHIADLADGVIDVAARGQFGVIAGSVLVSGKANDLPRPQPVGFHLEGGRIRWHPNR